MEDLEKYKNELPEVDRGDEYNYKKDIGKIYEIIDSVIEIEIEALKNGNFDKAKDCISIYNEAYSKFSKDNNWDIESKENLTNYIDDKLKNTHKELIEQKFQEYETLSPDATNGELINKLSEFSNLCMICNTQFKEDKKRVLENLNKVINEKISKLDIELKEAKAHIELPENEAKCEELQKQIEELETEIGKARIYSNGTLNIPEETIQRLSEHRNERIETEGPEMNDIMTDIDNSIILKDGRKGFYKKDYERIEDGIEKKTEYLEKKLALLENHRDIPGNEERISTIEKQLEQMQDSWEIAKGKVYIDDSIRESNRAIKKMQRDLLWYQENEPERKGQIKSLQMKISDEQSNISRLEQENKDLENGINKNFIGDYHRKRIEKESKAKLENEAKASEKVVEVEEQQENKGKIEQDVTRVKKQDIPKIEDEIVDFTIKEMDETKKNENDSIYDQPILTAEVKKEYETNTIEKYRPREESIKDQIGDDFNKQEQNETLENSQSIDLWMNRFSRWNNAIDRLSENAKAKFIKMKSDILKAIRSIAKHREQNHEINNSKGQNEDLNER